MLEDAGRLIKLIRYTNTLVITPMKTFDLADEYDRDMFERELKRGNEFLEYQKKIMNRGRLLSVSQGNYVGSVPPYGYDKIFIQEGKRSCPTLAINEEQANVEKKLTDIQAKELSQWEAQSDPDPTKRMPQHIFKMLNEKLIKEREETELALKEAINTIPEKVDYKQKIIKFQNALDALQDDKVDASEKNRLLKECIYRLEYYRDKPQKVKGKNLPSGWSAAPIKIDVKLKV